MVASRSRWFLDTGSGPRTVIEVAGGERFAIALLGNHDATWTTLNHVAATPRDVGWVIAHGPAASDLGDVAVARVSADREVISVRSKSGAPTITFVRGAAGELVTAVPGELALGGLMLDGVRYLVVERDGIARAIAI